jgi:histidine triad (HIT) family protein
MSTVFDKIIAKEIPASIVYEDDRTIAFLDINPVNKGHTLVVPKTPFKNILDGDAEALGHLMQIAKIVAKAVVSATGADGVNLVMNNGEAAGQEVPHAHIHLIPRFKDDRVFGGYRHQKYTEGEMEITRASIAAALK